MGKSGRPGSRLTSTYVPPAVRPDGEEPVRIETTSSSGSYRLIYGHVDPETGEMLERASYQAGEWLARAELTVSKLPELLEAEGFGDYQDEVEAFLTDMYAAVSRYGPLLMRHGADQVPEDVMPSELQRLDSDRISITINDEYSDSSFGCHLDTPQLKPFACAVTSAYAEGYYDYTGGEFVYLNGVVLEQMTERSIHLGVGHRCLHTVLPVTPAQARPGEPMLRASFVLWGDAGCTYASELDKMRVNEAKAAGPTGGEMWAEWYASLATIAAAALSAATVVADGKGRASRQQAAAAAAAPRPAVKEEVKAEGLRDESARLNLFNRLRGGAAPRKCPAKQRRSKRKKKQAAGASAAGPSGAGPGPSGAGPSGAGLFPIDDPD